LWGAVDFSERDPDSVWLSQISDSAAGEVRFSARACTMGLFPGGLDTSPRLSPPVLYTNLPIITIARLHFRADLLQALGGDAALRSQSDNALILEAWKKWGNDCPKFLEGEFVFAIWDERRRSLFLCLDPMGSRDLYYWQSGSRLVFSTDPRLILRTPGVDRVLNRAKLSDLAVIHGHHFRTFETFHAGINAFPSGSWSLSDRSGMRQQRYWEPTLPTSFPRREDEYFESLREALFQSVEHAIEGAESVTAHLSGGLDSSAIVSIAAKCLEKKNRSLVAVAGVLPDGSDARFVDERDYIDEFRAWPNVRIEYVSAPGRGPFDCLDLPGAFESRFKRSSRFYLNEALDDMAASHGADVLLSGVGGELGPTYHSPEYYLELATRFHWITLAHEMRMIRRVQGQSPIRTFGGQLLRMVDPLRGNQEWLLFTKEFRRECQVRENRKVRWPDDRQRMLESQRLDFNKPSVSRAYTPRGIPLRSPFRNRRVLELCLAAPRNLKVRNGYPRNLIRGALDGILPRRIQWRTSKTLYAPDYSLRYNSQLGKARDFMAAIGANDPVRSIIDIERLKGLLVPAHKAFEWNSTILIPNTLYLICFLRQFAEFRP
jgi:asparagine synthase (glutamine-hydrolysing)